MSFVRVQQPTFTPSQLGGAPYIGYSTDQFGPGYNTAEDVMSRRILTKSWNGNAAVGVWNGYGRIATPFRAITGGDDFLSRVNYACNVPTMTNKGSHPGIFITKSRLGPTPNVCDNTGIPSESCNPKFVADSSDYIRFKKLRARNQNYNDLKGGGDQSNASYVPRLAVRGSDRKIAP